MDTSKGEEEKKGTEKLNEITAQMTQMLTNIETSRLKKLRDLQMDVTKKDPIMALWLIIVKFKKHSMKKSKISSTSNIKEIQ